MEDGRNEESGRIITFIVVHAHFAASLLLLTIPTIHTSFLTCNSCPPCSVSENHRDPYNFV